MLTFVGVGPTEGDITKRAVERVERADVVYLEGYTNYLPGLDRFRKKFREVDRGFLENRMEEIIKMAKEKDVVIITLGNPLVATTHFYYFIEGRRKGVRVEFIHSPSILDLVLETGLHVYKFGKIASISFHHSRTPYEIIRENLSINAHTLILLDLDPKNGRFIDVREGLKRLLEIEEEVGEGIINENSMVLGCARLGMEDRKIVYGKIKELLEIDFGGPPHCIVFPARKLHFTEEEALKLWRL